MTENLIKILNMQHDQIHKEMENVQEEASKIEPNYDVLLTHMTKFKEKLLEHLELEDAEFYPRLEEMLRKEHEDPTEIIEFGKTMVAISAPVKEFLEKYDTRESIEADLDKFRRSLVDIMTKIFMRISSEDVFIHSQWELYFEEENADVDQTDLKEA